MASASGNETGGPSNPPPPIEGATAASNPLEDRLLQSVLDLEKKTVALRKMLEMEVQRSVQLRSGDRDMNISRPANQEAVAAQAVGTAPAEACTHCQTEKGAFTTCVVVNDFLSGSCAVVMQIQAAPGALYAHNKRKRSGKEDGAKKDTGKGKEPVRKGGKGKQAVREQDSGGGSGDIDTDDGSEGSTGELPDDPLAAGLAAHAVVAWEAAEAMRAAEGMMLASSHACNATAKFVKETVGPGMEIPAAGWCGILHSVGAGMVAGANAFQKAAARYDSIVVAADNIEEEVLYGLEDNTAEGGGGGFFTAFIHCM